MSVDNQGNLTHGVTLHDVIRNLIRGRWPNTEENQRRALLAVDAHEQGFADSASWEAELQRRAEVLAPTEPVSAEETDAEKIARLEADNVRLHAAQQAAAGRPAEPSAQSAPEVPSEPLEQSAPEPQSE